MKKYQRYYQRPFTGVLKFGLVIAALGFLQAERSFGAPATIFADGFESYSDPATSLADTSDADPANPLFIMQDDNPVSPDPVGSGIQLINWMSHSGTQALLVRGGSEMRINLPGTRTGTQYTLDFWVYATRQATADRGFRVALRGEGADSNGDDLIAYRVSNTAGMPSMQYYDGVGPGTSAWTDTTITNTADVWQHHRLVIDPNAQTFNLYVDDMTTPLLTGVDLSRPDVAAPTQMSLYHEGNSTDDGYVVYDDVSLTAEGAIDLATTFTEGFESYPARTSPDDDADPQGPWVTVENDGNGNGKTRAPAKVQVVGVDVITPHSGSKCLKLEYGQRAGSSLAWGVPPQSDVQVTWWARVPATQIGGQYNYLRMSLYGSEGGNAYSGDCALLGYGCRDGTVGDATSLTYYNGGWINTDFDFTPDAWEEYRLTTHNSVGLYTIIKNPNSSSPQVIVDRKPFIGTAADWGPTFMAAWSSSNGTNHPAVYIDDIEVKSLVSIPNPRPKPYTGQI